MYWDPDQGDIEAVDVNLSANDQAKNYCNIPRIIIKQQLKKKRNYWHQTKAVNVRQQPGSGSQQLC